MLTDIFVPIKCKLINSLFKTLRARYYNTQDERFMINYELVLGMKVKPCIDPQDGGARFDLDFPRIYVWDRNNIKEVNVTVLEN